MVVVPRRGYRWRFRPDRLPSGRSSDTRSRGSNGALARFPDRRRNERKECDHQHDPRRHGTYATTAAMALSWPLTAEHPADLAALVGARLVVASETDRGRAWDEARLKALTGGDAIAAHLMRQNFFTFTPTFKLLSPATTTRPSLRQRRHAAPSCDCPIRPHASRPDTQLETSCAPSGPQSFDG